MGKVTLTARELRAYRRQLLELDDRLGRRVSRLEAEALRPSPTPPAGGQEEPPAHEADLAVQKGEDEVTMAVLGSEEHVLNETRAALARLDAGTFGKCERCGHAVARARLDALPYARFCARCAREEEAGSAGATTNPA
jgi:RNA polymerase-binding transcription factor DksA